MIKSVYLAIAGPNETLTLRERKMRDVHPNPANTLLTTLVHSLQLAYRGGGWERTQELNA